ncbi:thymidine phosphorylase family protein [Porticoccus sp.]
MEPTHVLEVLDMGIDTHQEPVVYMREDCDICRAEGFSASSRLTLSANGRTLIATLNVVDTHVMGAGRVGLSKIAMQHLRVKNGSKLMVQHTPLLTSLSLVRKKIYGHPLNEEELNQIIADISSHRYSDIAIASFLSACAGNRLDVDEITALTKAMVACGKRLEWPGQERIFDKHCIGGLPGNRTTPIVVSVVSAAGLTIPKTSSRAITSPAGTADTMETLTNVDLKLADIQRVVSETGACLAWGGGVNLSPADDLLIRIERALDLDGEGQLIASVLSKKIAAGSTHTVIDIPVGDTAKIRTQGEADRLASLFSQVGAACGIQIRCVITDGSRPVGFGIGPVEEARDILAVLQNRPEAPQDLRQRSLMLSAHLLDMANGNGLQESLLQAEALLTSGQAWQQFQRIIRTQGRLKVLPDAHFQHTENADHSGVITAIDNRRLARVAKLAGAPFHPSAGLRLAVNVGQEVSAGQPLFTLFSESKGERDYALAFYRDNGPIFTIGEAP